MNTEAVMCMAFTNVNPSCIPDLRTISSILGVMLRKPMRCGTLNVRYSVWAFMCDLLPIGAWRGRDTRCGLRFETVTIPGASSLGTSPRNFSHDQHGFLAASLNLYFPRFASFNPLTRLG